MEKVMCMSCEAKDATHWLYIGRTSYRVCQDCHVLNMHHQSTLGIEKYFKFLLKNYEFEAAVQLAKNTHNEDEIKAIVAEMNKLVPMFTFGILKYPHNIKAEGGRRICENAIVRGHIMYATYGGKGFPVTKVTNDLKDIVYGTYFEIPRHVVTESYDYTEGYSPDREPENNMYNRTLVDVTLPNGTKKKANMYIANPAYFVQNMVPEFQVMTGNFDDRYTHLRQILDSKEG